MVGGVDQILRIQRLDAEGGAALSSHIREQGVLPPFLTVAVRPIGAVKDGIAGAAEIEIGVLGGGGVENGDRPVGQSAQAGKIHCLLVAGEPRLGVAAVFQLPSQLLDFFGELSPGNGRGVGLLGEQHQQHAQQDGGQNRAAADGLEMLALPPAAHRLAEGLGEHREHGGQQGRGVRGSIQQNKTGGHKEHQRQGHGRRPLPDPDGQAGDVGYQHRQGQDGRAVVSGLVEFLGHEILNVLIAHSKGGGEIAPQVAEALSQLRTEQKGQKQQNAQQDQRGGLVPLLIPQNQGEDGQRADAHPGKAFRDGQVKGSDQTENSAEHADQQQEQIR